MLQRKRFDGTRRLVAKVRGQILCSWRFRRIANRKPTFEVATHAREDGVHRTFEARVLREHDACAARALKRLVTVRKCLAEARVDLDGNRTLAHVERVAELARSEEGWGVVRPRGRICALCNLDNVDAGEPSREARTIAVTKLAHRDGLAVHDAVGLRLLTLLWKMCLELTLNLTRGQAHAALKTGSITDRAERRSIDPTIHPRSPDLVD